MDEHDQTWTVAELQSGGVLRMTSLGKEDWTGHASVLAMEPVVGVRLATAPVAGLQPDPPAAIARVARHTSATVLPSPVAPETNKSGIVPDGQVKYLGNDGFLHVVKEASSRDGIVDEKTRLVRED
jgi:hypothetical protein